MLPEFPASSGGLCTCSDFARRGLGTCKHIVAAERWLRSHPDAKPPEGTTPNPRAAESVWKEVDLRLAERGVAEPLDIREVSRPGEVLLAEEARPVRERSAEKERRERVGPEGDRPV
jgi:hypothetical protein